MLTSVFWKADSQRGYEYTSSQLGQLHKDLAAGLVVNGYSLWIFQSLTPLLLFLTEQVAQHGWVNNLGLSFILVLPFYEFLVVVRGN